MEAARLVKIFSKEDGNVWAKVAGDRVVLHVGEAPVATLSSKNLPDDLLTAGNLTMNVNTRQVSCNVRYASLTRTEFDILRVLIENQHRVTSYQKLIEQSLSKNAFHQHLHALRLKLRVVGWNGRITTIRGVGVRIIA